MRIKNSMAEKYELKTWYTFNTDVQKMFADSCYMGHADGKEFHVHLAVKRWNARTDKFEVDFYYNNYWSNDGSEWRSLEIFNNHVKLDGRIVAFMLTESESISFDEFISKLK